MSGRTSTLRVRHSQVSRTLRGLRPLPCTFAKKIMLRTMAVNLPVHFVPIFLRSLFMGCIHVPGTDRKLYISAIDYISFGESRTDPSYTPFLPFTTFPPPNHAVLNWHHYIRSTHNSPKYPQIRQYSSMEIELHPVVSLLPETFSVLVAPLELMAGALNSHLELQRYKVLHVCGNYCLESSAS